MSASMDDVALESGVSKATVSRVLNNKSGVAKKRPLRRFMTEVIIISRSKFPAVDRFSI